MNNRIYIAIDLKSFYASVECVERRLDPLDTNLVVAVYFRIPDGGYFSGAVEHQCPIADRFVAVIGHPFVIII